MANTDVPDVAADVVVDASGLTPLSEEETRALEDKIVFVLSVFPGISWIMLQMGLGPNTKSGYWRPLCQEMIEDGKVILETELAYSTIGQYRSYPKLYAKYPVNLKINRCVKIEQVEEQSPAA